MDVTVVFSVLVTKVVDKAIYQVKSFGFEVHSRVKQKLQMNLYYEIQMPHKFHGWIAQQFLLFQDVVY